MIFVCHLISDQNLEEETRNKKVFFQKRQSERPVVEVISSVRGQKTDSLLQKKVTSKGYGAWLLLLGLLHFPNL
jgi:hypothetical protein